MNNIYFTSDTHFGHANIIKYSNRPFSNVSEMNETIIENWNKTINKNDIVYHLGDFGFMRDHELDSILKRLNGQKFLIFGNHDKTLRKMGFVLRHFIWSKDYFELNTQIKNESKKIVLAHYPFFTWNKSHHGSWNLHGHCHGSINEMNKFSRRIDVGVDCPYSKFTPISLKRIEEMMNEKDLNSHLTQGMHHDNFDA